MKDVLIVCYGMGCGGAEKSLISFLNRLPKDRWNVDLSGKPPESSGRYPGSDLYLRDVLSVRTDRCAG